MASSQKIEIKEPKWRDKSLKSVMSGEPKRVFSKEVCSSAPNALNRSGNKELKVWKGLKKNFLLNAEVYLPPFLFNSSYNQDSTKPKGILKYLYSRGQRK